MALMIQGTASGVGKSVLAAALCRLAARRGLAVAPFKAQNLALNAAVTAAGDEIGRAQAVQAAAAGLEPEVDMNPVLLKPEAEGRCQVVLRGKAVATISGAGFERWRDEARGAIAQALERLLQRFELVVIEGAGSPVELNLVERDLANMHVARLADARVLLVGDAHHGGVFASLLGTLELLPERDRARVVGLVINRLRGDVAQLAPGTAALEHRARVPVLGVLPWLAELGLPSEDSSELDAPAPPRRDAALSVAAVRLPCVSNHDELEALGREPDVRFGWIERQGEVLDPDLVLLPGTKSTRADLAWLRARGLAEALEVRARQGRPLLGICGGYQMLGRTIEDPGGVEGPAGRTAGLALLPCATRFRRSKTTRRVEVVRGEGASFLTRRLASDARLAGYEIHCGAVQRLGGEPLLRVSRVGEERWEPEGAAQGAVAGTLVHGLLEDPRLRASLLEELAARAGTALRGSGSVRALDAELDRVADHVAAYLDLEPVFAARAARVPCP